MILRYFKGHPQENQPVINFYHSLMQDTAEAYEIIGIAMSELIQALEKKLEYLPEEITVGTSLTILTFFHPSQKAVQVTYEAGEYVVTFVSEYDKKEKYIVSKARAVDTIIAFLDMLAKEEKPETEIYFVAKLLQRSLERQRYSVHILNKDRQTVKELTFSLDEMETIAKSHHIPIEVFRAALQQEPGQGDYVDQSGKTHHPYL